METDSELIRKKYQQYAKNAVDYFCRETGLSVDQLKIHIVASRDYISELQKRHMDPNLKDNSNAMFIPKVFQNEETKKLDIPFIILNVTKLAAIPASQDSIQSVIVHELIHYFDYYFTYPSEVVSRYGDVLSSRPGTKEYNIGGYFLYYSEFRAKRIQEKYMLVGMTEIQEDYMAKTLTKIDAAAELSDLYYSLSHARAQLINWEALASSNPAKEFIEKSKHEIEAIEKSKGIVNLAELEDLAVLFKHCDTL
ncbi:hypothetical protein GC098_14155 [Paenibacillus sp. LMG 31458]|uniref:Peptidase MA-like domain-containing protein n=1 Tax=Paenibacillus phytorum TaxID=2654977 RepID=A0ABX1XXB5_9BACL|nr:hypothetical protein [Paenibacillus phytorum]NOU72556.1 hypothetical protein [Paenibacillus phytorum]